MEFTKKHFMATAGVLAIMMAGALGTQTAFAQGTSDSTSAIVQKLAEKFGLDTAQVQAVFDQEREARHTQMQAAYEKRLVDAVTKGELTEVQKQLILGKYKEMLANKELLKEEFASLTRDEIKAKREAKRQELETWAKANGIDMKYLGFFHRVGHGGFEQKDVQIHIQAE